MTKPYDRADLPEAIVAWTRDGERTDPAAVDDIMIHVADHVALCDPIRFRTSIGKQALHRTLTAAFAVMTDKRFTALGRDVNNPNGYFVVLQATLFGGAVLTEVHELALGPDGRIERVALTMRPLRSLFVMMAAMGPQFARQRLRRLSRSNRPS